MAEGSNGNGDLERRATELAQQRLLLRDKLADTWAEIQTLKGELRDVSARERALYAEMRAQGR